MTVRGIVPIRLGADWFGLAAEHVREIVGRAAWVPIPGAPASMPGVIAWQGRAVALADLCSLLGLGVRVGGAEGLPDRLLVTRLGPVTLAIPADAVQEVIEVPEDQLSAPHVVARPFVSAEVPLGDKLMAVLDLDAMVSELSGTAPARSEQG